jgi:cytidylate kinase
VVAEIARIGRAVLVGRAAVAVLGRHAEAIHVLLVAPKPFRTRAVMERLGLDEKAALKAINDTDNRRARYHKEFYQRDWLDPTNYHMVFNTELLGFQGASELIAGRAKALGWG